MPPTGAVNKLPPRTRLHTDPLLWFDENRRPGMEQIRVRARTQCRGGRQFGERNITGAFNKALKLFICDRRPVYRKPVNANTVSRTLLRIMIAGAHPERAGRGR